jgi:hypothetical protein
MHKVRPRKVDRPSIIIDDALLPQSDGLPCGLRAIYRPLRVGRACNSIHVETRCQKKVA